MTVSGRTRRGDDLRRIHWPSSARQGDLQVRQFRPPRHGRLTVVIDTRPPGDTDTVLDVTTSIAASITASVLQAGDAARIESTDGRTTPFFVHGLAQLDPFSSSWHCWMAAIRPCIPRFPPGRHRRRRDRRSDRRTRSGGLSGPGPALRPVCDHLRRRHVEPRRHRSLGIGMDPSHRAGPTRRTLDLRARPRHGAHMTRMRALRVGAELALLGLTLAAAVSLERLFVDTSFLPEVALLAVGSHVVAAARRRAHLAMRWSALVSIGSLLVLGTAVFYHDAATLLVPTRETASALTADLREAWQVFSEDSAPVDPVRGFVAVIERPPLARGVPRRLGRVSPGSPFEAVAPAFAVFVFSCASWGGPPPARPRDALRAGRVGRRCCCCAPSARPGTRS
ncbi:MAG: DUF58 domain-containing protein [Acidimicrobiales bacterium]